MWVNGKRVKENWHAKKVKNKLREMKKSGNNIPKNIRKELIDFDNHFYNRKFTREHIAFEGKLKVTVNKISENVYKGNTPQKRYSLKAIKNQFGDGEYSQQYYSNARISNNPSHFKGYIPYDWTSPDGYYHDSLQVKRTVYRILVESPYRSVAFTVATNPNLKKGGFYSKQELLNKFTDKKIQEKIEYVSYFAEVTLKKPSKTAFVGNKKFGKYMDLDKYYEKEYQNECGHFKKKACPKERGTLHNQLKAIAQTCNKALQNKSFDKFDSEIDTLSSLEPQVLPKDYHYWR